MAKIQLPALHEKQQKLLAELKRDVDNATQTYTTVVQNYPITEAFIRALPVVLWENMNSSWTSGNWISVHLPWNMAIYKEIEKALKKVGLVLVYEDDPAKKGNAASAQEFRWRREEDKGKYDVPTLVIYLNASLPNSTCKLVPLEVEKKVVTTVKSYERLCPKDHPELFDADNNYIGQPLVTRDLTKGEEDEA